MDAMTPTAYAVHPAADSFRLMREDELASLAASIAANGQRDPIILGRVVGSGEQPMIVDGRNRAKACGNVGVIPKFEIVEFEDEDAIVAFIEDRSERRDLSKSERAMSAAIRHPIAEMGRGKIDPALKSAVAADFSDRMLRKARQVLQSDPDIAIRVRDGVVSLDAALAEITEKQKRLATKDEQVARLRVNAPELADLVREEKLPLADAVAALDDRERKAIEEKKNQREVVMRLSEGFYRGALAWSVEEFALGVAEDLFTNADFRKQFFERLQINPALLDECRTGATSFIKQLRPLMRRDE
jgi:hypothetical protein